MIGRAPVLVTGAAGFIGTHLTRKLASLGYPVRALDLRSRPGSLRSPNIVYVRADIRDADALQEALDGVDLVYHLASVHLDVHASEDEFRAVNVEAAETLASLSAAAGVRRLVHTSSVGIYGHLLDPPASEDAPRRPQTAYERTKLAGEEAAARRARSDGLDLVVLRPAWVYGPGCPRTAKLCRALRKRRFFFIGDGSNLRHPLYIDDLVQAYLLSGSAPASIAGHAYIIAGPRAMTLREMVNAFATALDVPPPRLALPRSLGRGLGLAAELAFGLMGRQPPFSRRSLAFFENDNAFEITAAQRDLDYRPTVDLAEGLRRTLSAPAAVAA